MLLLAPLLFEMIAKRANISKIFSIFKNYNSTKNNHYRYIFDSKTLRIQTNNFYTKNNKLVEQFIKYNDVKINSKI